MKGTKSHYNKRYREGPLDVSVFANGDRDEANPELGRIIESHESETTRKVG